MKQLKRLTALVLSVAMVFSMGLSAFANTEVGPVCSQSEGCVDGAHGADCALYEEPAAEEAATTEETTEEEPTTEEPVVDEPTTEKPEEPVAEKPTTEEPEEPVVEEPESETPPVETPAAEQPAPEEPMVTCDGTADCKATENHQEGCLALQVPPVQPLAEQEGQVAWKWYYLGGGALDTVTINGASYPKVTVTQGQNVSIYVKTPDGGKPLDHITPPSNPELARNEQLGLAAIWNDVDKCVNVIADSDCATNQLFSLQLLGLCETPYEIEVKAVEPENYNWRIEGDPIPNDELILNLDDSAPQGEYRLQLFRNGELFMRWPKESAHLDSGDTGLWLEQERGPGGSGYVAIHYDYAQPGQAMLTYQDDGEVKASLTINVTKSEESPYKLQYKLNDVGDDTKWSETSSLKSVQVGDEIRVRLLGPDQEEILLNRDYHLYLRSGSGENYDYYHQEGVCQKEGNYALIKIPYTAAGARLSFVTNLDQLQDDQQVFSFSVEELPGDFELQAWRHGGGNAGTWDIVDSEHPALITVGDSRIFRMLYKEEGKADIQLPLGNREFGVQRGGVLDVKYHGNGTAQVYAMAAPSDDDEIWVAYGVGGNFKDFSGSIVVEGQSYVWYEVGGQDWPNSRIDIAEREDKTVTLGLKQGDRNIFLNQENLKMPWGFNVLRYNEEGTITVTMKGNNAVLQYLAGGDNTMPIQFEIENDVMGPCFVNIDIKSRVDEYTFNSFADSENDERYAPGRQKFVLNDGPNDSVGPEQLDISKFSIWDENGDKNGEQIDYMEGDRVACDFFTVEHRHDEDNSKTTDIILRARKNGTAILRYELSGYGEPNDTRYGYLKVIVDVKEHSYALYRDDGEPFATESGDANGASGTAVVTPYGLRLREMNNGVPGDDLTDRIISINPGQGYDARNENNPHVWNGISANTENCALWVDKDEDGQWAVYTRSIALGEYHLPLQIQVEGLQEPLDFEVHYTVSAGTNHEMYYYVSANNASNHRPTDFTNIQDALDAANEETNVRMLYVVLRHGVYEGEQIDSDGDGCLELHLDRDKLYQHFSIQGEGNVTIKGSLNFTPKATKNVVLLSNLTFQGTKSDDDDNGVGAAIHVNKSGPGRTYDAISLQNVTIDGYNVGVDGDIFTENSTNVTIKNCTVGLKLRHYYRDASQHVLRTLTFKDNDTAIQLTDTSRGQFKIRQSSFINNDIDIKAEESGCRYINAAFNDYVHGGKNSIASHFSFREDDNSRFFYSPYTRKGKEVTRAVATSEYYIDPEQMNGLIIDADEAKQVINSSNFKDQDISIDIVTTVENEETGLTESKPYATWNFGEDVTASAEAMDFTPRIDLELPEESQAVVDQAGVTNYQPVSFLHSGELPATATVNVTATEDLGNGNLYLYKVEGDQLVLQEEKVSFQNGEYTFDRPTCSDYIITDKLLNGESSDNTSQSSTVDTSDDRDDEDDDNDFISGSEVEEELSETKGDKATISIISRNKVAKKAFAELAKTDKTLVLRGEGYSWSIEGSEITKPLAAAYFKTGVRGTSPYGRKINKLVDTLNYQIIQTEHHGELPGKMTLRLKVKDELRHSLCYLYYYNSTTGEAEAIASGLKADGKGYVEIVFDEHLSTYFLTDRPLRGAVNSLSASGGKANPGTGAF